MKPEIITETLEVLERVREELDGRSDVMDGGEDGPRPNWAMVLLRDVEAAIKRLEAMK